jgi:hypothetical protein
MTLTSGSHIVHEMKKLKMMHSENMKQSNKNAKRETRKRERESGFKRKNMIY